MMVCPHHRLEGTTANRENSSGTFYGEKIYSSEYRNLLGPCLFKVKLHYTGERLCQTVQLSCLFGLGFKWLWFCFHFGNLGYFNCHVLTKFTFIFDFREDEICSTI